MITEKDMATRSRALRRLLQEKLGVQGRDLGDALGRAGRLLPRAVRARGDELARAEMLSRNPRIARQVDAARVARAHQALRAHLLAIDVTEQRKGRVLAVIGAVAANLLAVAVMFVVWLWWRGYV